MDYHRLKFSQYFIDNSEDYNHTGLARRKIDYKAVSYECDTWFEKLMKIKHEVNFDIWYEEERDVIQINFQKSNGRSDWFANIFEFSSRYYDSIEFDGKMLQLRVHHGWAEMYKTIKHEIRDQWKALKDEHPDAYTEIIGWSLGSGQAILCAQDLNYNFGVKPYLYTFGSVKPFKATLLNYMQMRKYMRSICEQAQNFANINDLVTYMPPFYGFMMPHRVNVGFDPRTLLRLLNPNHYHTIYDQGLLYARRNRPDFK